MSYPGSLAQDWHNDGPHLFPAGAAFDAHCPPHAVNVFVPLVDLTAELGPTELALGTHVKAEADRLQEWLASAGAAGACVPLPKAGDALIFDWRLMHRGTSNPPNGHLLLHVLPACACRSASPAVDSAADPEPDPDTGLGNGSESVERPMLYLMYSLPWYVDPLNFDAAAGSVFAGGAPGSVFAGGAAAAADGRYAGGGGAGGAAGSGAAGGGGASAAAADGGGGGGVGSALFGGGGGGGGDTGLAALFG